MPKTAAAKKASRTKKAAGPHSKQITRRLKTPPRIWYKPLSWRHRHVVPNYKRLPKARLLFSAVVQRLWSDKRLFGGIVLIYGLFNIVLVRGLAGSNDLQALKTILSGISHGFTGKLAESVGSFVYLLSTSGSGNNASSGVYQAILFFVCSLAFIWALRQRSAHNVVTMKQSFYEGMYPLVPFILLFMLLSLQLVPLVAGSTLYSTAINNGIAVHAWEKMLWLLTFIVLGVWSLRMITPTIFALYIVTLPEMTPLKAYRSARQLIYGRRLIIWRKLIFLPVIMLVLAIIIEVPLILYLTPVAEWTFFVLTMLALPLVHGYLYNLYREML